MPLDELVQRLNALKKGEFLDLDFHRQVDDQEVEKLGQSMCVKTKRVIQVQVNQTVIRFTMLDKKVGRKKKKNRAR